MLPYRKTPYVFRPRRGDAPPAAARGAHFNAARRVRRRRSAQASGRHAGPRAGGQLCPGRARGGRGRPRRGRRRPWRGQQHGGRGVERVEKADIESQMPTRGVAQRAAEEVRLRSHGSRAGRVLPVPHVDVHALRQRSRCQHHAYSSVCHKHRDPAPPRAPPPPPQASACPRVVPPPARGTPRRAASKRPRLELVGQRP